MELDVIISPGAMPAKKAKRKVYKKIEQKKSRAPVVKRKSRRNNEIVFKIFDGYRWAIPSAIKVSESVRWKFSMFETYPQKDIIRQINLKIRGVKTEFVFSQLVFSPRVFSPNGLSNGLNGIYSAATMIPQAPLIEYVPPPDANRWQERRWAQQQAEWRKVRAIYNILFKMKRMIYSMAYNFRVNSSVRNVKNVEDVVTMDVPRKVVRVLDLKHRCSYVYEASTMRRLIENRISLSDYMFPNPMPPLNPLTNMNLTQGQLISVIQQCKSHGQYSWILDGLLKHEGNVQLFSSFFKQPLKVRAIENHFKGSIYTYKDEVLDFFDSTSNDFGLPGQYVNKFSELITDHPGNKYVRQWVHVTKAWYIASELEDHSQLYINARLVNILIGKIAEFL